MRYQSHLLIAVLASGVGHGQSRIDAVLARFADNEPSVSVAIVNDGKFVTASRGLANLETHTKASTATNYRLASMTKQFTATAILLLVQDKKLRLDQTLSEFFPRSGSTEFPAYARFISIRNLLTHTSGLWDYEDLIPATQKTPFKDAEAVKFSASHATPAFQAGVKFQYSNTGYAALAEIVRMVSGMSFREFLKTRVFEPLGMDGTVAYEEGINTIPNRAFGYTGMRRTDQDITSSVLGDGGIYSSIKDLVRWNAALDSGKLLPRDVIETATTATALAKQYGYGWFVDPYGEHRRHWHAGETIGFRSAIQRFPDRKLTVIVLSNQGWLDAKRLSLELADLYLK